MRIGLDIVEIPVLEQLQAAGVTVVDGQQAMLSARSIKCADEIILLSQAAAMVDAVYQEIYEKLKPGKAALEASVRYLAGDLGAKNIRVNAVSAGPIKTLAAAGISGFSNILQVYRDRAPLKRNVELGEVADAAVFLLSPAARAITGEIVMVDAGYHVIGI
jgi:enoyl-[acyl-carrier-protein] reductase (NADH)